MGRDRKARSAGMSGRPWRRAGRGRAGRGLAASLAALAALALPASPWAQEGEAVPAEAGAAGAPGVGTGVGFGLGEALALTYATNPDLDARRARLRATAEQLEQAASGRRPRVEATGDAGVQWSNTDADDPLGDASDTITPAAIGLNLVQPLYRGGRTEADIRRAQATVRSAQASLTAAEQDVLLAAAQAYLSVLQAQAVLQLAVNNVEVLERQLQATRDRFSVGEVTRTDVAQAEAAVAEAVAIRVQSAGDLEAARATFVRAVGRPPDGLAPAPVVQVPASLEDVVAAAQANNPNIAAAEYAQAAAEETIELVRGELRPEVNLTGQLQSRFEPSLPIDRTDTAAVLAEITVPLYEGGATRSRIREARESAAEQRRLVDVQARLATERAVQAWEALQTAAAAIEARRVQAEAAEVALRGLEQEALVGARTVLDVLDAEQDLLNARVSLVQAQRDEVIARFTVLSAAGLLTADYLGLPVQDLDPVIDLSAPDNDWWNFPDPFE